MRNHDRHGEVSVALGVLLALAAVLAACGGSTKSIDGKTSGPVAANATTTDGEVVLAVTANDFSLLLNRTSVPAGRVHVQLSNHSKGYPHEVWVYPQQQPQMRELLAAKRSGQQLDEQDYLPGLAGHVEDIAPGQTAAFDVTLQPGTYELACFILSPMGGQMMPRGNTGMGQVEHYDMGMHTLLIVQ